MNSLDNIKKLFEAGSGNKLVSFSYPDRHNPPAMKTRTVEPYSFRIPKTGSILFYAWDVEADAIRAFNLNAVEDVEVMDRTFVPRFEVELNTTVDVDLPLQASKIMRR